MSVIDEIAAERKRQIEKEGYDAAHDDRHDEGEIAMAAACYAAPDLIYVKADRANTYLFQDPWPWDEQFDKRVYNGNVLRPNMIISPERRRSLLVKAGALIVAEIDRLDRQSS